MHPFVCGCMKSIFIIFNTFDLLNFHLTFIGHSPLLHLLQELLMTMACIRPARRQDGNTSGGGVPGTSQQQDPGTTRAPALPPPPALPRQKGMRASATAPQYRRGLGSTPGARAEAQSRGARNFSP